jgi:hypothetical protein
MGNQQDIYDSAPWSEMDIQDLKIAVKLGYLPDWLAEWRSRTVGDVLKKAAELGLQFKTKV